MATLRNWLNLCKADLLAAEKKQKNNPSEKNLEDLWYRNTVVTWVSHELKGIGLL